MLPITLCTPRHVTYLIRTVADYYKVTPEEIIGKRRQMHLVRPRWVVMYLLRKRTDYSLQNIGFFLGDRDHCTIWHGVRKVAAALEDSGCDLAIEIRQIEWDLEVQEAVA